MASGKTLSRTSATPFCLDNLFPSLSSQPTLRLALLRPNIRFFPPPPPTTLLQPDPTRLAKAASGAPSCVAVSSFSALRRRRSVVVVVCRSRSRSRALSFSQIVIGVFVLCPRSRPSPPPSSPLPSPIAKKTPTVLVYLPIRERASADRVALFHLSVACLPSLLTLHRFFLFFLYIQSPAPLERHETTSFYSRSCGYVRRFSNRGQN